MNKPKTKTEVIGDAFVNASKNYTPKGYLKGRGHVERVKLTPFYSKVAGIYLDHYLWEYVAFGMGGGHSFNRVFAADLIMQVSILAKIPFSEMASKC